MNIILISGTIGSGKSSFLRNKNFRKKFNFPQKILSTDLIAKNMYSSEISGYGFQKNPYLRMQYAPTEEKQYIHKNKLRKHLFFSPSKKHYWNALEKILHPQVIQKILEIVHENSRKKGTLFIECAVPQKLFSTRDFRDKIEKEIKISGKFSMLKLILFRGLSPREISGFLQRQNV